MDLQLDKLSSRSDHILYVGGPTPFARFLTEIGMRDVWRERNLDKKLFSCYSAAYKCLSCRDFCFGSVLALSLVTSSDYAPCNVSDHSPLWVVIDLKQLKGTRLWEVNSFWFALFPETDGVPDALSLFLRQNAGSTPVGVIRDAFKAYLRGLNIKQISLPLKQKTSSFIHNKNILMRGKTQVTSLLSLLDLSRSFPNKCHN